MPARARATSPLRDRIASEALRLFALQGYSAVSVRDIAEAAQTTNPMIYYYFGSKTDLYRQILHQQIGGLKERVVTATEAEGSATKRLAAFCDAYLDFFMTNKQSAFLIRELFGLGSDLYGEVVSDVDAEMRRALRRVLRSGVDEGVFRSDGHEMVVISIIGILNTFVRRRAVGAAQLGAEEARRQVVDYFVNGLRLRDPAAIRSTGAEARR